MNSGPKIWEKQCIGEIVYSKEANFLSMDSNSKKMFKNVRNLRNLKFKNYFDEEVNINFKLDSIVL